jgi:hypothetical protein
MNRSDEEGKQINLSYREAAELASQAIQDDADSLILLLMGVKEQPSIVDAHILIDSAISEVVRLSSVYSDLRDDYIGVLVRNYRGSEAGSGARLQQRAALNVLLG